MVRKENDRILSGGAIALCIVLSCILAIGVQAAGFKARKITYTISGSVGLSGVTINGLPDGPVVTDEKGSYTATVEYKWSGAVTPTKEGYTFQPASRSYTEVTSNQDNQDYTPTLIILTISGTTGVEGVVMTGLPGNPVTDKNGTYRATVDYNFSGTVTPTKEGYTFTPPNRTYAQAPIKVDEMNQNYTAELITFTISGTTGAVGVTMTGLPGDPVTSRGGTYNAPVQYGFTGKVTPTREGYTFTPPNRQYTDLTAGQTNQDYSAKLLTYTISGIAGMAGVVMKGLPGAPVTDANGYYTATADHGFSGIVTPTKEGYSFEPANRTYDKVTADQPYQGYAATLLTFTISGTAGVEGVLIAGLPGEPVTDAKGHYSASVDYGFSDTVTPTKEGYTFIPPNRTYALLTKDQTNEDYTGSLITFTISGTTGVEGVLIAGLPGQPVTDKNGTYTTIAEYGFSGVVTPTKEGYTFEPTNRQYTDLVGAEANQDYVATLLTRTISGIIIPDKGNIEGVLVSAEPAGGSCKTDAKGAYELSVDYGWIGTVTPTQEGYTFEPPNKKYSRITKDQTYQGYSAKLMTFTISDRIVIGGVPIEGVSVTASSGGSSDNTDAEGKYSITVPYNWSGSITPTKEGYLFEPPSKSFTDVTRDIKEGVPVEPAPKPTRLAPPKPPVPKPPTPKPDEYKPPDEKTTLEPGMEEIDEKIKLLQQEIERLREGLEEPLPQIPEEVIPDVSEEPEAVIPKKGRLISAIFVDTDMREALQEIASRAGVEIHTDDTVKGTVTCKFEQVPVEKALAIVLKDTGYAVKKIPHSYLVYTPISNVFVDTDLRQALQDIATMADVTIVLEEAITGLVTCELKEVPLQTALEIVLAGTGFVVNKTPDYYLVCSGETTSPAFPVVSEMRRIKMNYVTADTALSLLSSAFRPYVQSEIQTHSVCITAPPALMKRIVSDLKQIDRIPRHVMLDARIVVMERGDLLNLGVEWGWPQIKAGVFSDSSLHGLERGNQVRWPWGIEIGYASDSTFTDSLLLALNLLAENSEARILASPQLLAQDGKVAEIKVMTEEYYMMTAPQAAYLYTRAELEKIESGTRLTITPRIGDNNDITLDIDIEISDSIAAGRGSDLPVVTRRTARNTVRIKDGGTVALAGLTESRTHRKDKRVPGLSNIPILGTLFRNTDTDESTREITVFVTARLIRETEGFLELAKPFADQARIRPARPAGDDFKTSLRDSLSRPTEGQPPTEPAGEEFKRRLRESLSRPSK